MGSTYLRGQIWWIKYYRNGRAMRETSRSGRQSDAKKLLAIREGDIARGLPIGPRQARITIAELLEDVKLDYMVNRKKSYDDLEARCRLHLLPFFGVCRASSVTTDEVRSYVRMRQKAGATNGTINRELTALKRAYNLATQGGKLLWKPHIPMLEEDNVRQGFFEYSQFLEILRHLPSHVQPVVRFAQITGWRSLSEILPLQWNQVDFADETIRLEPGTTKNKQGRIFPMTVELRHLLQEQWAKHTQLLEEGSDCPWVFPYKGQRFKSFKTAWKTACRNAGLTARIAHDFRRTAVRNLTRAGIVEGVAMQMTGHLTRSVFERYNIVSRRDLEHAKAILDSRSGTTSGTKTLEAVDPEVDVKMN
jgi:integrase